MPYSFFSSFFLFQTLVILFVGQFCSVFGIWPSLLTSQNINRTLLDSFFLISTCRIVRLFSNECMSWSNSLQLSHYIFYLFLSTGTSSTIQQTVHWKLQTNLIITKMKIIDRTDIFPQKFKLFKETFITIYFISNLFAAFHSILEWIQWNQEVLFENCNIYAYT